MSQIVSANFDNLPLEAALQSLINQTDGSVAITLCSGLKDYKVALHSNRPIPFGEAIKEMASQVPATYYPYGMLDAAVAHPVLLCKDKNDTAVTIRKPVSQP